MGNQIQGGDQNSNEWGERSRSGTFTPKKSPSKLFSKIYSNEKGRSKTAIKEGLYANERPFENFENTAIFGFRLDTDPEEREFYVNCPLCNRLNLDNGLGKTIECKDCKKEFDLDDITDILSENFVTTNKHCFSLSMNKNKKIKKIQELNNLVVITNRDTLFDNFVDKETNDVNYDLITKKILLPYYKIKSRIMKKGMYFKIGEIGFKVAGVSPFKKGVVTSKTYIRCNNSYSLNTPISRALMITTNVYDNFDPNELRKEILTSGENNLLINKNEVARIKQYEFYVRNCEPNSGVLTNESQITIENKDIMNISKLKVAIIKNNVPQFQSPMEKRNYEDYILKEYYRPYFLSGVKKYVERGDVFQIEDLEMFILNSYPENGFVSVDTHVMFKLGLNKEKCLEKINNADNKFAFSLLNLEEGFSHENLISNNTSDYSNYEGGRDRVRSIDELILRGFLNSNRLNFDDLDGILSHEGLKEQKLDEILRTLPTFTVDEIYLKNLEMKSEQEVIKKCIICMDHFEIKEVLKTLPCFHIFHSNCIDEWLTSNNQCPICKQPISE